MGRTPACSVPPVLPSRLPDPSFATVVDPPSQPPARLAAPSSRLTRSSVIACGAKLGAAAEAAPGAPDGAEPAPVPAPDTGERRQLTVLFCDLVDSTRLAAERDAEEWREIVRGYQRAAAGAVERYGGHVAQYLGDGVLAYFGWPRAHGDDAERALRAGFGIRVAVEEFAQRGGPPLALRIGIHTGPVVVGEMGAGSRRETLAMGDTTNLAARLQGAAEPGSIVASAATLRLAQGLFLTRDLGPLTLKGVPEPAAAFELLQAAGVRSRLDASEGLVPLVGREQELGLLLDRWEQVRDGFGQAVLIAGEAGIGKSRLVHALRERVKEGAPLTWLECRCSPYTQDSALYPVVDLLHQALAFTPQDGPAEKLRQLRTALEWSGFALTETLPLIASFLSLPIPEDFDALALSPEGQRKRTLTTLTEWLLRLGRQQPVILLFEDINWVDPSTLELLGLVLDQIPTARVMAICTYRPGFQPPWSPRSHVTPLLLSRLTRAQSRQMVERASGGVQLPPGWVEDIIGRADGVPLFLEELAKALAHSDFSPPDRDDGSGGAVLEGGIPETLRDPLMARLDQLGPLKELAQLCSCIGREFSYPLVLALEPLTDAELRALLDRAVEAELFYQRGSPPEALYLFKHGLIQEAAYQSLLRSSRQRYHQRIAETLEARFAEVAEAQPELLAHHFAEAGAFEAAVRFGLRAARRAAAQLALVEARRHLGRAFERLRRLDAGEARDRIELELQLLQGGVVSVAEGYAAGAAREAFERARALCDTLGERALRFAAVHGLFHAAYVSAEREASRALAEELLRLAELDGDTGHRLLAHRAMGITLFLAGQHHEADAHLRSAMPLYDARRHHALAWVMGENPMIYVYQSQALNLLYRGRLDAALSASEEGIALARSLEHPLLTSA